MYSGQIRPTVEYDRKIRYLDYMENGQRSRGAGFVKLERRDEHCNISLQISGLYRKDHFTRPLLLIGGGRERELCKLQLADGGLKLYLEKLDSHNLDGQGMDYEQLTGLRIPISEGKEIQCLWEGQESRKKTSAVSGQDEETPVMQSAEEPYEETLRNEPIDADNKAVHDVPIHMEDGRESDSERPSEPEEVSSVTIFKEDKWDQLWSIYPHICPFSDEREYLSLGPGDFVMLPGRYYKLVNNSFLLHGYYNYHHLILTRVRHRDNMRYYIGVPGNLYQKEKKIAIMFGFEGFECASEPAGEGAFGYYLIPVEL